MKVTRMIARGQDGRWVCPFCGEAFVWFEDPGDERCVQGLCPDGTCNTVIMVEERKMRLSRDHMELIDATDSPPRSHARGWSVIDGESSGS